MLRRILPFLCLVAVALLVAAQTDLPAGDRHQDKMRHFLGRLNANRALYSRYNDSILAPVGRDEWVGLFDRCSRVFKTIFDDNMSLYYEMSDYLADHPDSNERYDALYRVFVDNNTAGFSEPFARAAISASLLRHYRALGHQSVPDTSVIAYLLLQEALQQYNISRLGDTAALDCSWEDIEAAYRLTKGAGRGSSAHVRNMRLNALNNICAPQWLTNKKLAYPRYCELMGELEDAMEDTLITRGVASTTVTSSQRRLHRSQWNLIRNLHLIDSTAVPQAMADSAMDRQIASLKAKGDKMTLVEYLGYHVLLIKKGLITPEKAWETCLKRCQQSRPHKINTYAELLAVYPAVNDMIYINDVSSFTPEQKHANALLLRDQAIGLFHNQTQAIRDHSLMMVLNFFVSYDRLLKHLTLGEKVELVHGLMMRTQICTYAHMHNVTKMVDILMRGVRKYRPDLIPDTPLPESPERYAHHAALFHDWGKLRLAPIIANDFRRLNENEVALIRSHPQRGYDLLGIDSALTPYRDVALGHHRWHDGTRGYPETFDNTASPVRFYIDLVAICDALEAGTDPVGRNYFLRKPFVQMIYEMAQQKGRYNPDLVNLIRHHDDVYQDLRKAADSDRHSVYYDIYTRLNPEKP